MEGWVNLSGGPTHSQVDLVSLSEVDRLTSRPNESSPVQSSHSSNIAISIIAHKDLLGCFSTSAGVARQLDQCVHQ